MAPWIDWIVAIVLTLTAIAVSLNFVHKRVASNLDVIEIFELKNAALDNFKRLFDSFGIPKNWNSSSFEELGLIGDLYKVPILINETAGTDRTNEKINLRIALDENCEEKAWNSTLRLKSGDEEVPFNLNSTTFCSQNFINTTNLTFCVNISANSTAFYFLYFSPEKEVETPSYPLVDCPTPSNPLEIRIFPEEKLKMLSLAKLRELKKIDYRTVRELSDYEFNIEIRK